MDTNELAARLEHPSISAYFTGNGHRMAAIRALLDLMNMPYPAWAARGISGVSSAKRNAVVAFIADNPQPRTMVLPDRKTNASPERIEAVKVTNQRRLTGLYDQTFSQ